MRRLGDQLALGVIILLSAVLQAVTLAWSYWRGRKL